MSTHDAYELAADEAEREALMALSQRLEQAGAGPALPALPADLRERTLAAVAQAAGDAGSPPATAEHVPQRRRARRGLPGWLRPPVLAAGASLAAAAVLAVVVLSDSGPEGTLEANTALTGSGGSAAVEVREIGIGRTVDLKSDSLKILPEGEYYEVWFVGPGDSAGKPNRISAGTFHPDSEGKSEVQLKAAVNPKVYSRMEVTAEPGDGDPRASGPAVLSKRLDVKG